MTRQPWLTVAGFIGLWVILALVSPTRTLHLAPVAVGLWPVLGSVIEKPSLATIHRIGLTGIGIGLAAITTLVLTLAGGLEGPSLLSSGGAPLEAYVFAVVAGLTGLAISPIWREQK